MHILAEISLLDPTSGTRTTVRTASAQDRTITGLNSQKWWTAMITKPSLGLKLFDGDFTSTVDPGNASFALAIDALELGWPGVRSWAWAGASVTLYAGESGQAWPWSQVFVGSVDEFKTEGNKISVTAAVDTTPFEVNVLVNAYAGTGGAEGGSDLAGQVKPMLHGRCRNVEPVLVDATNSVYQFHGYGAIDAVEALFERGSDFGASVGNYATYAALVAATVPAGRWATCLAQGMVRLGAPAYGVITGDVRGDAVGGYRNLTGAIIARVAAIAGVSGAKIDTASLTALDTAVPYPIGIFLNEQTSVIDLARRLALPCNTQAGVSWLGLLFVTRISVSSPSLTLDAQGKRMPPVIAASEVDVRPPYKRILFGSVRSWRVHTADEIATSAERVPLGLYDPSTTYREGNLVSLGDGSTFLYINTTASSGNAPPTPTSPPAAPAANSWWQQIGPPLVALSGRLTNEAHVVTADASGNVSSYSGASGSFQIFDAGTDVSSLFTLSTVSNPQSLTVNYSSQTYTVTAGLDAGEPSAVLTIRASGSGVYAGKSVDKVFSIAKATGGATGSTGAPGLNNAILRIYQRAASAPTLPSATVTYTFATGGMSGLNNGWSATIPAANGQPLYVATAVASAASSTDTIASGEWATPVVEAQDGATGAAGANAATVFLYQRNDTGVPPSVPASTTTYTFATGALSGTLGSWTQTIPDAANGAYLYVTTATALGTGTTDTIGTGEWAAVRLMAQSGDWRDVKFMRSLAQPATPTGSSPSGWFDGVPAGTDTLWSTAATKDFAGNLLGGWSTPESLSGLTPRGAYDAGTTYYLNNSVTFGGGSYTATQDSFSNHAPTGTDQANAYWDVLAAPGSPGTPATPPSAFSATINLSSSTGAVNLRTLADANGYTGLSNATVNFVVPNGVTVQGLGGSGLSGQGGGFGIDTGTWPSGTYTITLTLTVQSGGVVNAGGGGGGPGNGGGGGNGGDAIYCRENITVTINSGGTVRGGGGGGGGGGFNSPWKIGAGGGGGGSPNGGGGDPSEGSSSTGTTGGNASGATAGSAGSPGAGAGGTYATAGSAGTNTNHGPGGAAGYAVRKNGKTVPVTNSGTMTGTAA